MRKIFISICIMALFLSGCGKKEVSDDSGRVTITFWHSFVSSTQPALTALVERFEKDHPGIKVNAQYVPTGDALIQKLVAAIQSDNAPDISWIHSNYLANLVEADAIYKMDTFINGKNPMSQAEMDDIYPALIQYASYKKVLYSLPMEATNMALLYNKELFKKAGLDPEAPPRNWTELRDYTKKLTVDKNGDGVNEQLGFGVPVYPASGPLGGWMAWQWTPFLWQAGGYVIDEEQTKVLFNSEAGVKALSLWKDLYWSQNHKQFTTDLDVGFASEKIAMIMDGPWNLPRYKDLLKNLDWSFAPLPGGDEGQASIIGGEYLVIFKASKHPDESWAFLKWITEPENQAKWAIDSGYLPIRKSVKDVPEFKEYLVTNPNFAVFVEQLEYSRAQRPIDEFGLQISNIMAEAIEKATLGQIDPAVSLNESAEKCNALLDSKK